MAPARKTTVDFSGPPGNISASGSFPNATRDVPHIAIGDEEFPIRTSIRGDSATLLAFSLPAETQPGKVKGEVYVGGQRFPAIVDVLPSARAVFEPPSIRIEATPGASVSSSITVTNAGNSDLPPGDVPSVRLRPAGALRESVASAFREKTRDFADRLVAIGESIQEFESHEMEVDLPDDLPAIAPKQCVTVELVFRVPADLDDGTSWSGSTSIYGARIRVDVQSAGGE